MVFNLIVKNLFQPYYVHPRIPHLHAQTALDQYPAAARPFVPMLEFFYQVIILGNSNENLMPLVIIDGLQSSTASQLPTSQ